MVTRKRLKGITVRNPYRIIGDFGKSFRTTFREAVRQTGMKGKKKR